MRSVGAMEGRRHGRGGGGVGDAGGCGARARWHVPTGGGSRRGAGGESWESHRARCLRVTHDVQRKSSFAMRRWLPARICMRACCAMPSPVGPTSHMRCAEHRRTRCSGCSLQIERHMHVHDAERCRSAWRSTQEDRGTGSQADTHVNAAY